MLNGRNNEEKIWNYLKGAGLNDCGAAGLMGNLYAESGLRPDNLQNTYEKKLGMTDASYTAAVDGGTYTGFVRDCAGYGLAQWTYWSRKQGLFNFAKAAGRSIGDLEMQLDFLMKELREGYKAVLTMLKTAGSVRQASDAVLLQFERPGRSERDGEKAPGLVRAEVLGQVRKTQGGTSCGNIQAETDPTGGGQQILHHQGERRMVGRHQGKAGGRAVQHPFQLRGLCLWAI